MSYQVIVHCGDTPGTARSFPERESMSDARDDWRDALTSSVPHMRLVELVEYGEAGTRAVDVCDPRGSAGSVDDIPGQIRALADSLKTVEPRAASVNAKKRAEGQPVATDRPLPSRPGWVLVREEGVCGACGRACWARDPEGRAVHPRCEGET